MSSLATNAELMKEEGSVKRKFLGTVANLPYKELKKKIKKTEYKKLVFNEIKLLLLDFDKVQLGKMAQYISNALNNKVQELLLITSRGSNE